MAVGKLEATLTYLQPSKQGEPSFKPSLKYYSLSLQIIIDLYRGPSVPTTTLPSTKYKRASLHGDKYKLLVVKLPSLMRRPLSVPKGKLYSTWIPLANKFFVFNRFWGFHFGLALRPKLPLHEKNRFEALSGIKGRLSQTHTHTTTTIWPYLLFLCDKTKIKMKNIPRQYSDSFRQTHSTRYLLRLGNQGSFRLATILCGNAMGHLAFLQRWENYNL